MKKFFTICLLLGMAVVFINANNDELYYNFANEQVLLDELDLFEYANFPEGTSFEIFQDEVDDLGIRHQSYQQMYNGIKVQSKMILVHSKNGQLLSLNGNVMKQDVAPKAIKQNLNKLQARKKVNSETDEKDITLTILCINGIYYTVYKVPNPETLETFYIDAESGEIVYIESALQSADVKTQALTRYSGWQEMSLYETDGKYVFLDSARNIVTLGAKGSPKYDYYYSDAYLLSLPDSIIQKIKDQDKEAILNNIGSPMMWDYINQCNVLYHNSPVISIPTITNITITNANSSWWYDIWDTNPDIFIEIYNSNSQRVYKSSTVNDATFPISFSISVAIGDGYVIQVYDEDVTGNSYGGGIKISTTESGTYSWSNSSTTSGMLTITEAPTEYADIHWGMQKTYDFYKNIFKRNSFDNQGHIIYNIAFPQRDADIFKSMPNNAVAQGDFEPYFMYYGYGDGAYMNPVVALDIMAHEFTHLVTSQNGKGGLDYLNESGALNESFSDIMAMGVKKYTYGSTNWTIGEDVMIAELYLRSMKNPNSAGQPDTYGKGPWIPSTSTPNEENDKGGVHTNSGVQNFWFYLLSEGGTGTNDNNEKFTVKGIGIDKALQIAYRTLIHYLTPSATFANARQSSLQAARDLYGANSTEEIAVTNAWHAVGVGDKYVEEPTTSSDQFLVLAQRKTGGNWFYMTADLGTAGIKRFQAIDAGTSAKEDINRTPDGEKYLWSFEDVAGGVALKNSTQYATWNAGNSAILSSTPKAFSVVDAGEDIVNISFVDGDGNTRYLSLNATEGNNYFAFYKGTTQKYNLLIIPYGGQQPPIEEPKEEFVVLAQRNNTSNWFYMTADLGTASTKRFQAVDAGTPNKSMINTSPTDSKYIWSFEEVAGGIALVNEKQYASWKSGNSAILSTTPMALNITDISDDQVNMSFVDNEGNTRYLSLNATEGNNYFAFYKGTTQKYNLLVIPYGEKITTELETITLTETPIVQKIMRDGQLLILRDGKTYNVMGQEL